MFAVYTMSSSLPSTSSPYSGCKQPVASAACATSTPPMGAGANPSTRPSRTMRRGAGPDATSTRSSRPGRAADRKIQISTVIASVVNGRERRCRTQEYQLLARRTTLLSAWIWPLYKQAIFANTGRYVQYTRLRVRKDHLVYKTNASVYRPGLVYERYL